MTATLLGLAASHPVYATELMLHAKGVPYRRVDLPHWFHRPMLRALGFPGKTVPVLWLDGRKLQTTKAIARELDALRPEPPLLPADPELRARVEEIEDWCDGDFQQMLRRLVYWVLPRHVGAAASYFEGSRSVVPFPLVRPVAPVVTRILARDHESRDDRVRADLAALPAILDRIDGWIEEGLIGGETPNVADHQFAATLALLMTFDDLRPLVSDRPAGDLVRRHAAGYPGRTPPAFPREWLS